MNTSTVKILSLRSYVGRTMPRNGDHTNKTKQNCISAMVLEAYDRFEKDLLKQRSVMANAGYSECVFIYNEEEFSVDEQEETVHVSGYVTVRWAYDVDTAKGFLFTYPEEELGIGRKKI
jgi:hypothetical protein